MSRAIRLAGRGQGLVEPNPMVGCVIVRGGQVLGEGYHRRFGGPHAEVVALTRCADGARRATAYVTLEPCHHHGKTPPCTAALIEAGVRKVVVATRDPNPLVAGRGIRALKKAGIDVVEGVLRPQAADLNAPYMKLQTCGLPYVIAKWAQSIDGRIAGQGSGALWISGPAARKWVHRLRARMDGIIVGSETVLKDDPRLTCRGVPARRVARRIILDTRLRTPLPSHAVRTARRVPTTIFTARASLARGKAQRLRRSGVGLEAVPLSRGHVSLRSVLRRLAAMGMTNVLIEGGGHVLAAAFDAELIDEAYVFVAPKLIGGPHAPAALLRQRADGKLRDRPVRNPTTTWIGPDLLYHFTL